MLDLMDIHHLMSSLPELEQLRNKKNQYTELQLFILLLLFNLAAKLTYGLTQLVSFSSKSWQTGTAHGS